MKACVFVGPSLPWSDAARIAPALSCLPPAGQGCIIEAVERYAPTALGLIDGYFRQHPSVWHKEILWALDQGIRVYGAASMGALRAAELEAFGMIGVGAIFESFRRGALPPFDGLCDDDEVAIAHGPADTGYMAVTEALVNMRSTLACAREQGILERSHEKLLLGIAKKLHFSERRYKRVVDSAAATGLPAAVLQALLAWLPEGRIDQKRLDAEALLQRMSGDLAAGLSPGQTHFQFALTELFQDALDAQREQRASASLSASERAVLDALATDSGRYRELQLEALLLLQLRQPEHVGQPELRRHADRFRRRHGLFDREQIDAWLERNRLSLRAFDALLANDLQLQRLLGDCAHPAVQRLMLERLRAAGLYASYAARAERAGDGAAVDKGRCRRE